jgi:amidase
MSAANARELAQFDAVGCAELVRTGQVSPVELVEAAIVRIESTNPQVNAVIYQRYEKALEEAAAAPRAAPFAGVPTLIKDAAKAGEPDFNGSEVYAQLNHRAQADDCFTERLERAGMIILGQTNIPEFTSAPVTESRLHGPCRNPWDVERTPGGSSGGAAAAVAAAMVPAAQSSDGGGSTRIPASAVGLFTIKPSRGRIPLTPSNACWADISNTKSFITRTVRDFAALLDVVLGPDPAETVAAPAPARAYAEEVSQPPGRLRIGVARQGPRGTAPPDPEAVAAVDAAATLLADLGHQVEETAPDTFLSDETLAIILGYWPIKVAMRAVEAEHHLGRQLTESDLEPATFAMLRRAREQSMADTGALLLQIRAFTARSLAWWRRGYDLLLTPMTGTPAPKIGAFSQGDEAALAAMSQWAGMAPFANITGQPAASAPLYWTPQGLPIGVQLIADVWREDLLVRLSAQLEQARPWRDRRPPVHA